MSLIFGVWSRHGKPIPNAWQNRLWQRGMCEHLGIAWIDARLCIQKIDIGAFASGWNETDTHVTALAGDAILTRGVRDRADDLRAIESGELDPLLKSSRGYFNLARYNRRTGDLTLAVDRIGMRCLYVYDDGEFVIFSGALRILERLEGVTLTIDRTGVLQEAAFGLPLGERTRYLQVRCLRGGTIWRNGVESRYWEWRQSEQRDPEAVMDEMYATFQEGVSLRRGKQTKVFASLSGGLDSRCGATELWRQGVEVESLNVSWKGSYDEILGKAYAQQLGFKHRYSQRAISDAGNTLAGQVWRLSGRAKQIWGGTQGGVSVGHIDMTRTAIEKLRAMDKEGAAREFLRASGIALSGAVLKGDWSTLARNLPLQSVLDEMPDCHDRSLWFFKMRNYHRRILSFHMEQIDIVACEWIEPLADPQFLSAVAALPIDFCLRHNMYYEWLKRFPAQMLSVPWQAYPASLPCPVPLPDGYTQWAAPVQSPRSRMKSLRSAYEYLCKGRNDFLSHSRVALAYVMHSFGRDTAHLLRQAELIERATSAAAPRVTESVARRLAQLVLPA